jgi:hypothetical protein
MPKKSTSQKPVPAPVDLPPEAKSGVGVPVGAQGIAPNLAPEYAKVPPPKRVNASADPLACQFDNFPPAVLAFAQKNSITPLKWRSEPAGYVLFSIRLQKYHIPIQ